jgi:hypothetical protein
VSGTRFLDGTRLELVPAFGVARVESDVGPRDVFVFERFTASAIDYLVSPPGALPPTQAAGLLMSHDKRDLMRIRREKKETSERRLG